MFMANPKRNDYTERQYGLIYFFVNSRLAHLVCLIARVIGL